MLAIRCFQQYFKYASRHLTFNASILIRYTLLQCFEPLSCFCRFSGSCNLWIHQNFPCTREGIYRKNCLTLKFVFFLSFLSFLFLPCTAAIANRLQQKRLSSRHRVDFTQLLRQAYNKTVSLVKLQTNENKSFMQKLSSGLFTRQTAFA